MDLFIATLLDRARGAVDRRRVVGRETEIVSGA
jgi:hypothetical protein